MREIDGVGPADEFTCEARVAAGPRGGAVAYTRTHRFEVGAAVSFDRDDPRVSALEYLLGAVGGDLLLGLQRLARRHRIAIHALEATVEAHLENPLVALGVVGETGEPALAGLRARVYVTTDAAPEAIEPVWREALAASPLLATLRRAAPLDLSWKIVG